MSFGRLHEVADVDGAEQVLDAVVHLAQRFFDGAMAGEVACSVNGDATGDEERIVDGADDFERRYFGCRSRQCVPSVGAGVRYEQTGTNGGYALARPDRKS